MFDRKRAHLAAKLGSPYPFGRKLNINHCLEDTGIKRIQFRDASIE